MGLLHNPHLQVGRGTEGEGRGWLVSNGTCFTDCFVSLSHSFFIWELVRM